MRNMLVEKKPPHAIHYTYPTAVKQMSHNLMTRLPKQGHNLVIVCIGTDRSTGDALGPLTGTYLSQMNPQHFDVFGTLHNPVHAVNLDSCLAKINTTYDSPYIVAVDASLGKVSSIGNLISGHGPLKPGAALNKKLTPVGDIHLTGVVNVGGYMDFAVLQSTRLAIVHDMAHTLASVLKKVDSWYPLHTNSFERTAKKSLS